MFKKAAFVASTTAALLMAAGGPAMASSADGESTHDKQHEKKHSKHYSSEHHDNSQNNLVHVGDVASNNAVAACGNDVNVLGVQANDNLDGASANLPLLNTQPVTSADGTSPENCEAGVASDRG